MGAERHAYTADEDERLTRLVAQEGVGNWSAIASQMPGRRPKQQRRGAAAETHGAAEADAEIVTEAEGVQLHLSAASATGYRGVSRNGHRFESTIWIGGRRCYVGTFGTAVEAALAYARAVAPVRVSLRVAQGSVLLSAEPRAKADAGTAPTLSSWVQCEACSKWRRVVAAWGCAWRWCSRVAG